MENIADLYQTLGVEMPQDQTGVQDQEVAEPEETGVQDQEVADPDANDEGEDLLVPIEDDDTFDEIAEIFEERLSEYYEINEETAPLS